MICREWVDDGSFRGHPCHRRARFRVLAGPGLRDSRLVCGIHVRHLRDSRLVCGIHVRHFRRLGLRIEEIT